MNRAWPKIAGLLLVLLAMSGEVFAASDGFRMPADTRQLVIAQADRWDASEVTVQRWERAPPAESPQPWTAVGPPVKARVGRSGLAWGRGLHPRATDRIAKREGDWRAPAGVFRIGDAYGDEDSPPPATRLPYHRVTDCSTFSTLGSTQSRSPSTCPGTGSPPAAVSMKNIAKAALRLIALREPHMILSPKTASKRDGLSTARHDAEPAISPVASDVSLPSPTPNGSERGGTDRVDV